MEKSYLCNEKRRHIMEATSKDNIRRRLSDKYLIVNGTGHRTHVSDHRFTVFWGHIFDGFDGFSLRKTVVFRLNIWSFQRIIVLLQFKSNSIKQDMYNDATIITSHIIWNQQEK